MEMPAPLQARRVTREDLYKMVWDKPMIRLAEESPGTVWPRSATSWTCLILRAATGPRRRPESQSSHLSFHLGGTGSQTRQISTLRRQGPRPPLQRKKPPRQWPTAFVMSRCLRATITFIDNSATSD